MAIVALCLHVRLAAVHRLHALTVALLHHHVRLAAVTVLHLPVPSVVVHIAVVALIVGACIAVVLMVAVPHMVVDTSEVADKRKI